MLSQLPTPDDDFTLSGVKLDTTVQQIKLRLQLRLATHPAPSAQRLIYRGRHLNSPSHTIQDVCGREAADYPHALHLVVQQHTQSNTTPVQPPPVRLNDGRPFPPAPHALAPDPASVRPHAPLANPPAPTQPDAFHITRLADIVRNQAAGNPPPWSDLRLPPRNRDPTQHQAFLLTDPQGQNHGVVHTGQVVGHGLPPPLGMPLDPRVAPPSEIPGQIFTRLGLDNARAAMRTERAILSSDQARQGIMSEEIASASRALSQMNLRVAEANEAYAQALNSLAVVNRFLPTATQPPAQSQAVPTTNAASITATSAEASSSRTIRIPPFSQAFRDAEERRARIEMTAEGVSDADMDEQMERARGLCPVWQGTPVDRGDRGDRTRARESLSAAMRRQRSEDHRESGNAEQRHRATAEPTRPAQQADPQQRAAAAPAPPPPQPANPAQPQNANLEQLIAGPVGQLWLLFRIALFVYFFAGGSSWSRLTLFTTFGLLYWIWQAPWFATYRNLLRSHFEALIGPRDRPRTGPGAASAGALPGQSAAAPTSAVQSSGQRQPGDAISPPGRLRLIERAIALFLVSLWPGEGAQSLRRRMENQQQAAEEVPRQAAAQPTQQPSDSQNPGQASSVTEEATGNSDGVSVEADRAGEGSSSGVQPAAGEGLTQRH